MSQFEWPHTVQAKGLNVPTLPLYSLIPLVLNIKMHTAYISFEFEHNDEDK